MENYPDIPRLYTAAAEVLSCAMFVRLLEREKTWKWFAARTAVFFLWQGVFLYVTDGVPIVYWIPCMLGALLFSFLYIADFLKKSVVSSLFYTLRAFILAEFAASVEWQVVCFLKWIGPEYLAQRTAVLVLIFGAVFTIFYFMERKILNHREAMEISVQELVSAALISLLVFTFSNLSFVTTKMLFTSSLRSDIFNIRTLVDLTGTMILYAFQNRIMEMKRERELASINSMLKSQYDRYRGYQESIDLINMKYHDLKHQIEGMRAQMSSEERGQWLDSMEQELSAYRPDLQTGNQVLDAVLDSKMAACARQNIKFTCVVDGELLKFMYVMDLCTIFGNALDNAIESVTLVEDPEKRLIHLTVAAKKQFVFITVENYCGQEIRMKDGFPQTTKKDKKNHGFGLKSICYAVEKYGGTVQFGAENQWFLLKILIPAGSGDGKKKG